MLNIIIKYNIQSAFRSKSLKPFKKINIKYKLIFFKKFTFEKKKKQEKIIILLINLIQINLFQFR